MIFSCLADILFEHAQTQSAVLFGILPPRLIVATRVHRYKAEIEKRAR